MKKTYPVKSNKPNEKDITNVSNLKQARLDAIDETVIQSENLKTALAFCNDINDPDYIDKCKKDVAAMMDGLAPHDTLQALLCSHMMKVHALVEHLSVCTKHSMPGNLQYNCANMTVKLSHVFMQQANMLAKLQGRNNQMATVEKVNVESGGQAVVGDVTYTTTKDNP